ncbi:MAG: heparinase, partial [Muribaculaceae bacterium]|nr:heparinase [Muribaculaceae bacterium]
AVKRGYDLNVSNGNSSVVIRPLYPRQLAYSNFVHDYPEDLYWEIKEGPTEDLSASEEYYSFHLPATTNQVKGVTAIIVKDSVNQKELPMIERREGKDWIGLRVTYKGKVTDIYVNQLADGRLMHMNSWIDADGWSTDAYMLAVSYKDGGNPAKPDEYFVGHGSALRRDGDVYYSSLSKLNMITSQYDNAMDVYVTGQPRVNMSVKGSPLQLNVNGRKHNINRKGDTINIRLRNE